MMSVNGTQGAPLAHDRKVGVPLGLGIALMPYVFVWLLLREGYGTLARVVGFGWTALVLIMIITAQPRLPRPTMVDGRTGPPAARPRSPPRPETANAPLGPTAREAPRNAPCGVNGRVTQLDFAVATKATLSTQPRADAVPVNLRVGETEVPAALEQQATVRELCRAGSWSEVRVVTLPSYVQQLQGWVPSRALRTVSTDGSGRRVYQIADFEWPPGSAPYRAAAIRVMNRIMRDRPDCDALDRQSLVLDDTGGGRPRFSIPCFSNGEMISFDFTSDAAAIERSFSR